MKIPIHLLRNLWVEGKPCHKGTTVDVNLCTLGSLLTDSRVPFELIAASVDDLKLLDDAVGADIQRFSGFEAYAARRGAEFIHRQLLNARLTELETHKPGESTSNNLGGN